MVCSGDITNASQVMSSKEQANWAKAKESDATVMIRSSDDLGKLSQLMATKTWKFKMTKYT